MNPFLLGRPVSYITMTPHTIQRLRFIRILRDDVFHHRVVTIRTVGYQHLMAAVAHLDWLVKILEGIPIPNEISA